MAAALSALIRFYQTGEAADRIAYDIAWVQDRDSPVDTINGFVEVYMDPRGMKGAWEALVYYVNPQKTEGHPQAGRRRAVVRGPHAVGRSLQEAGRPRRLRQRHRRRDRDRRLGPGDAGRHQPAERSDDPRAVRQQVGVALERQPRRTSESTLPEFRREFAWSPEEAERAEKWSSFASELTTDMHEVIGHGSGRIAEQPAGQPAVGV